MQEERTGSPSQVPLHAFMSPDCFSLSLKTPRLGIHLSPCHTNIPHSAYAGVTRAAKHKVPIANACICWNALAHTHTHAVSGYSGVLCGLVS